MSYTPMTAPFNEVTVGAVQPTDLSELWLDTTSAATIGDHGNLAGLGDDDHSIYLNRSGVRAMTGPLAMGSQKITGLATPTLSTDAANKSYADSTFVKRSGNGSITGGNLSTDNTGYATFTLTSTGSQANIISNAPAGQSNGWIMQTGGSQRWYLNKTTGTESGSNLGSDLAIARYNDSGAWIDNPFTIRRDTGYVEATFAAATGNRLSYALTAATWTPLGATSSMLQTNGASGGFIFNGNSFGVPRAGLYLINFRGTCGVAGRFIVAFNPDSVASPGGTTYLADSRSYIANDVIGGSALVWANSYIAPFYYSTTAGTMSAYMSVVYVGSKQPT